MNPTTQPIRTLVLRPALLIALAILVVCAVVLLVSVGSALLGTLTPPVDGPLLAPFRWTPLAEGLA